MGNLEFTGFIGDDETIKNAEEVLHWAAAIGNSDVSYIYAYFKYDVDGKYYKASVNMKNGYTETLKPAHTPSKSANIGKKIKYNGKEYIVISDNGKELELVANYVSSNKVKFGEYGNYEDSLKLYNSAITTLNNACVSASGLTVATSEKLYFSVRAYSNRYNIGMIDTCVFEVFDDRCRGISAGICCTSCSYSKI